MRVAGRVLLITGTPGVGKTTLIRRVAERLCGTDRRVRQSQAPLSKAFPSGGCNPLRTLEFSIYPDCSLDEMLWVGCTPCTD